MVGLPVQSYDDRGREASARLEQTGRVQAPGSTGSPIIFPNDISSSGSFNNHFMIIDILSESVSIGKPFGSRGPARTLQQAEVSLVVYMPNTLQFTTQNDYEETSLTSVGINALGAMAGIGQAVATGAKILGRPLNPVTEVLFSNTMLRQFQFDFLFAPSTQKETETLQKIIYEMRRAAAVRRGEGVSSILWYPPRKLQVRFYQKIDGVTRENHALPKLKPVVIENLDFDFAPSGQYSTFSNGYPVAVRMMLRVKEDEVIERPFIEQNDNPAGAAGTFGSLDGRAGR